VRACSSNLSVTISQDRMRATVRRCAPLRFGECSCLPDLLDERIVCLEMVLLAGVAVFAERLEVLYSVSATPFVGQLVVDDPFSRRRRAVCDRTWRTAAGATSHHPYRHHDAAPPPLTLTYVKWLFGPSTMSD
jgi:hypothetical protein